MKSKLTISKPYLTYDRKGSTHRVSLNADIESDLDNLKTTLFFAVSEEYAAGLCTENADAFLVAVLPYCMTHGLDIESESPISRKLLYGLKHRLIPELSKRTDRYHSICINAQPYDSNRISSGAVGVGWSGGVDCIYTIRKHSGISESSYRITHLVNINAGVFEGTEEQIQNDFLQNSGVTGSVAKELGLNSLDIDTNIHRVFDEIYLAVGPFRLCAAILSMQKLFSVYYISSAYEISRLSFDEQNAFYYEYSICSCLSTQNVQFVESGCEVTRLQKIKDISENAFAQKHLHVCGKAFSGINCSLCGKCVRTVGALYALGKLESFGDVFDLNTVNTNFDRIMGDILYHEKSQHYAEVIDLLKRKGYIFSNKAVQYSKFLKVATSAAMKNKDMIMNNTGNIE